MSDKAISYSIPLAIELAGIFMLVLGVAVEISTQADVGHAIISVGSVLVAVGSIIWGKIFRVRSRSR